MSYIKYVLLYFPFMGIKHFSSFSELFSLLFVLTAKYEAVPYQVT